MEIFREFRFEAAHFLPHVPEGHKCRRMHGHSYRLVVHLRGKADPRTGWLMDFAAVKGAVDPVIDRLDHHCLNEIPGLENPTAEQITRWLWGQLRPRLPALSRLVLWETPRAGCEYAGEDE
jgi:6-pyruvoyltetrahydropterin/6-carboxytetrahydropterin synthase